MTRLTAQELSEFKSYLNSWFYSEEQLAAMCGVDLVFCAHSSPLALSPVLFIE